MQYYLNAKEWLEAQRLRTDRIADFVAEVLDTWVPGDEIEECEELVNARKEADNREADLAALEEALSESTMFCEFVTFGHDQTADEIRQFLCAVETSDEALHAIRQVLIDGGVLSPTDDTTPLPGLIAMFVPPA